MYNYRAVPILYYTPIKIKIKYIFSMSQTIQKLIKFSKGEINNELNERSDIDLLNNSASYIKNYIPTIFGGINLILKIITYFFQFILFFLN